MRRAKWGVWLRMVGVISAVGLFTTGITYAALQTQDANLTGNTIESATAALLLSKDGAIYNGNAVGFDFPNLIPGGAAQPSASSGYPLWLKNGGSAPLSLHFLVDTAPTTTGGVDLSKVMVVLTPVNTNGSLGTAQNVSIAALMASATSGGTTITVPASLASNGVQQYKLQVQMAADAFSGSSASVTNLELVFSGSAVTS